MYRRNCLSMCVVGAAAGFAFLMSSSSALAISITSSQYGGTVFFDDFESSTVGATPTGGGPEGIWGANTDPPPQVEVYGGSSAGPGAFQGSQYLKIRRVDAVTGNAMVHFPSNLVTTGTLHAEAMLYLPTGTPANGMEFAISTSTNFGSFPNNYVVNVYTGLANDVLYSTSAVLIDAGIDFAYDAWQKWELDLDLGAATFTVTVDGSSSAVLPFISGLGAGESILGAYVRGGALGTTEFYVDAVPEPSVFVLIGIGLIGVGLVARRERKK